MHGKVTHMDGRFSIAAVLLILFLGWAPAASAAEAQQAGDRAAAGAGPAAFSLPWTPPAPAYRIKVDADGLYALTYTALAAAGLPVDTLDPRSLKLFYMGQEVPMRVIGQEDGRFDAADVALFYGRNVDSLHLDGVLPTNKYTATNIYWLTAACPTGPCANSSLYGQRMAEGDGSTAGSAPAAFMHRERLYRSRNYISKYPFELDADHWFADQVTTYVPRSFTFSLANLSTAPISGTMTLRLLGYKGDTQSPMTHTLQVWLNNNLLINSSPTWTNFNLYETTVAVPKAYFINNNTNTVKIGLASANDTSYPDWYDIYYPDAYVAESDVLAFNNADAGAWRYGVSDFTTPDIEVYDVTDPFAPRRLINTTVTPAGATYSVSFGQNADAARQYLALTQAAWRTPTIEAVSFLASAYRPTDLRSAANAADYILITHRDFWAQAEALAAYRAYNFRVALVDVQQIYDQFNGGLMSAEAIHDFLAYAHAHWTAPAPAYVLLMGDGTNDMRNYRSTTNTYIPPYLYLADPDMGETAADNRFVTFLGDDNIPDMHIGRFPVNTTVQAEAMVNKVIAYETSCQCGAYDPAVPTAVPWQMRTIFMTDDLEDGGGNFYYYSDEIADGYADEPTNTIKLIPDTYSRQKEYLANTCDIIGNPTDAAQCRGNLVNALNRYDVPTDPTAGGGALFVSYVGHSSKTSWATENLFSAVISAQLTNGPCLPIMLPMTCFEGSFQDYQTPETVAEGSVRQIGSGSVASFSPTGFGLVTGHDYLERGLMVAWFHKGITRLGASVTYAKQYLVDTAPPGKYLDLLDTFMLFGDPALQVKATADACLAPTGVAVAGFTAQPAGKAVQLAWQTADESEILGFNLLRRPGAGAGQLAASSGSFTAVNPKLILARQSGVNAGDSYTYQDASVGFGRAYQYQLEIVKLNGTREAFGLAEVGPMGYAFYLPLSAR